VVDEANSVQLPRVLLEEHCSYGVARFGTHSLIAPPHVLPRGVRIADHCR
jgi:hypothetical protein